jgi:hypothetical protein
LSTKQKLHTSRGALLSSPHYPSAMESLNGCGKALLISQVRPEGRSRYLWKLSLILTSCWQNRSTFGFLGRSMFLFFISPS